MDCRSRQLHYIPHGRSHVGAKLRQLLSSNLSYRELTLRPSGAFIVDPLNKYFGRRGEIFITAACLTATPIGSAFTHSWQALFAARFVMGIGIGAKNATVPIYSAEMAPHRIRGALVMFWQLWVVIGTMPLTQCAFLGLFTLICDAQVSSWASLPTSSSRT